VLVDPGTYTNDVATWSSSNLLVRAATSTKPHLIANGSIENNMGVWRVSPSATGFTADGFEIEGAVSTSGNGAAIRVESGTVGLTTIRNCYFHDNQMNILAAPESLLVEKCELYHTLPTTVCDPVCRDGNEHNIYVNTSACHWVMFRYNYSHASWVGHEFKSRATNTWVVYNRLADENGTAGYVVDIPDGGRSYIIGNVIVQGVNSPNSGIVAYAAESAGNGTLDLYVINNTIVNDQASGGTFLQLRAGTTAKVNNNIFYGPGTSWTGGIVVASNNYFEGARNNGARFLNPAAYDYHLTSASPLSILNAGIVPGLSITGYNLMPTSQYVYDLQEAQRSLTGLLDVGAFEYGSGSGGPPDVSSPSAVRDLRNR